MKRTNDSAFRIGRIALAILAFLGTGCHAQYRHPGTPSLDAQTQAAYHSEAASIRNNPNVPDDVKARILARRGQ